MKIEKYIIAKEKTDLLSSLKKFDSIIKKKNKKKEKLKELILEGILQVDLKASDEVFVSKNKKKFTITKYIKDIEKNQKIGKTVITLMTNKENRSHEIMDIDITLLNDNPTELYFEEKLNGSSDTNEYYNVCTIKNDIHFQVETVKRYSIEEPELTNTKQNVYVSIFPFRLTVYENIDELNKNLGFKKPIKTGIANLEVHGFSEEFAGIGEPFVGNKEEICSFIIGKVVSFQEVNAIIGGIEIPFTIINLKTGFGTHPVAASKETFNLSNLSKDKLLAMLADVKVDFIK